VIVHNMEDDVIRGATVAHAGAITYPPPPPKVQAIAAQKPKEKAKELTPEERRAQEVAAFKAQTRSRWACWRRRRPDAAGGPLRARKLHEPLHRLRAVGLRRLPGDLERLAFSCTRR
jgi:hypothetical protein